MSTVKFSAVKAEKQVVTAEVPEGKTLIVSIKQTSAPSKIMVQFAEGYKNPNQPTNLLAEFNKADERFSNNNNVRYAWVAMEKENVGPLGITKEMIELAAKTTDGHVVIENLEAKSKGLRIVIQQNDSLQQRAKDTRDVFEAAKQIPARGNTPARFFVHEDENGERSLIFSDKTIVYEKDRKDRIIEAARIDGNRALLMTKEEVMAEGFQNKSASEATRESYTIDSKSLND